MRVAAMKTFRIGTFAEGPAISKISAYTQWYNPTWPGCIEYDIEAANGNEAKRIARRKRHAHEQELEAMSSKAAP
jgi:hypothetical protein